MFAKNRAYLFKNTLAFFNILIKIYPWFCYNLQLSTASKTSVKSSGNYLHDFSFYKNNLVGKQQKIRWNWKDTWVRIRM
jgi:hypothetical protein